MRYVVCYDMIVSGSVEIEADSLESAEETFGNMRLDELRAGLTGKPDLLTDSIQIAEELMIREPGKFCGCPEWAPAFYDAWLDGLVDAEPAEDCDCADAGVHCDHWLSTRISELDEELQCQITQDCEGMAVVPKHVLWRECDNGLMEFEVE